MIHRFMSIDKLAQFDSIFLSGIEVTDKTREYQRSTAIVKALGGNPNFRKFGWMAYDIEEDVCASLVMVVSLVTVPTIAVLSNLFETEKYKPPSEYHRGLEQAGFRKNPEETEDFLKFITGKDLMISKSLGYSIDQKSFSLNDVLETRYALRRINTILDDYY